MIPCEDCPILWARFYELDTNRPFFSDRDGIKKYDISEIGHERRNGYSWYNKDGSKVLAKYEKWKKELNKNNIGRNDKRGCQKSIVIKLSSFRKEDNPVTINL